MTHTAQLDWPEGLPFSTAFGDVYFSRDSGLEETRHVFIDGNRLPERFAALAPQQVFTIGETGFGTGLNFLCAWQCFRRHAPPNARLSFVSVEKFPLAAADLRRALALWPELAAEADALCARYVAPPPGWHRFVFDQGRVTLTLIVGEAVPCWQMAEARVDAWFLDGFAPSKNPDMWHDTLFQTMARLARPGASFATFTSAGFVRRGLQAAGFVVEKVPGYGSKREMSRGHYAGGGAQPEWEAPWFAHAPLPAGAERRAVIVGGGVAGAASAWSLANRGWQVALIERHPTLAREGSGNDQGVLYARLSAHDTPLTQLVLAGYRYSLALLQQLLTDRPDDWRQTGVLQLPVDDNDLLKQQALLASGLADGWVEWLDRHAASERAGIELPQGGLFFPQGGWLHPPALARALCDHPGIDVITNTSVLELSQNAADGQWVVSGEQGAIAFGSVVVLAGGADSAAFDCTSHLPLKRIRGQITHLPATADSQALRIVLCHEGYVAPARQGIHTLGASFKFNAEHLLLTAEEHQDNLAMLAAMAPALHAACQADMLDVAHLDGRAGWRCTSPDYLPLIGPVAPMRDFVRAYAPLALDASLKLTEPAPWATGLYVNTAHGSRGMITAPLSGEILAAQIDNEPAPLSAALMQALHPNRFMLRHLMRGKIDPAEYL
ncbi:bifunctional tRNA (5-methylaminomethyl-2-thiouridine)(34)-methyltransferase MnmD/FAD-dependent 5-carboxymethylaminomethyl-2-thiouridine(34) oxidoreductase MnmC [Paludibacterium sp.]|uniref:bifunctional tRNA (5-methylaminomethyl-2-thiouridine)(34)-methyltransferase MnmD/FAD-dependent 5-carboxymethylaminomethyl-2-thiouridine(34) oxidoreductase MnmC n=1 Tax=Paludibacterium sp. TaxID=1917523 RepID=UPI0025F5A4BE|nr:bifunctional tRNA (5-methylaminomethyl-2-thiouridine)(34)-methyltransferase MnmD/FAD-dependent 5-carboxymethylaminomethyl-2-thiouridine(34) oxidoreductase MnmC [Paludibacterium sp.]MBV8469537.1 bifunctional tRNA (5-methylaminomethyl-2-thiouridine)(34)-methyltransferase MnmD/FAD-dependent 5-carboxymethylaminomethyl-2-thiouridine(34) oxidoreductase MnmC [Burkholderiaceae bacterium]MBV8647099.1 bifunctional tRNA (5-methylaminomethyl-2-thiouridine)(34)-methyltransferase MnmD/FAD-dependent 5-carbox